MSQEERNMIEEEEDIITLEFDDGTAVDCDVLEHLKLIPRSILLLPQLMELMMYTSMDIRISMLIHLIS